MKRFIDIAIRFFPALLLGPIVQGLTGHLY